MPYSELPFVPAGDPKDVVAFLILSPKFREASELPRSEAGKLSLEILKDPLLLGGVLPRQGNN